MNRKADSQFIFYVLPIFLFLLISPLLARGLGPSDRGLYSSITNLYLVLAVIFGLAFDTALSTSTTKFLSFSIVHVLLRKYFMIQVVLSYLITFLVTFILHRERFKIFVIFIFAGLVPILVIYNLVAGWARNNRALKKLGLMHTLPALFRTFFIFSAYWMSFLTVEVAIFFTLLSNAPYLLYLSLQHFREKPSITTQTSIIFSTGIKAYPNSLMSICVARFDQVIGIYIVGLYQLGIYAVSVSIAEVALLVARSYRDGLFALEEVRVNKLIKRALFRTLMLIVSVAIVLPFVFTNIFGKNYHEGIAVSEVMLLVVAIQSAYELLCVYPLRKQRFHTVFISGLIYLIVMLIVACLLRHTGAIALAIGNAFGYSAAIVFVKVDLKLKDGK